MCLTLFYVYIITMSLSPTHYLLFFFVIVHICGPKQFCDPRYHKPGCPKGCGHCADGQDCHEISGNCQTNGCEMGWYSGPGTRNCRLKCPTNKRDHIKPQYAECLYPLSLGSCPPGKCMPLSCLHTCHCKNSVSCRLSDCDCGNDGCKRGYIGSTCQIKCTPSIGETCQRDCHCLNGDPCDRKRGTCPNGCTPRLAGDFCLKGCDNWMYPWWGCDKKCKCHRNSHCSVVDGSCLPTGCHYGEINVCDQRCHCYLGKRCDRNTGRCPHGCDIRYYGENCQKTCAYNRYTDSRGRCLKPCNCLNNRKCIVTNGRCKSGGCQAGWTGSQGRCGESCPNGTYGKNCAGKCHCAPGSACNKMVGQCSSGCDRRYYGLGCRYTCARGKYNKHGKCDGSCHCLDQDSCDVRNGQCYYCATGWRGSQCQNKCARGRWGFDCANKCGCRYSNTCDSVHGTCQGVCAIRKYGSACNKTCSDGLYLDGGHCTKKCMCKNPKYCQVTNGICINDGCDDTAIDYQGQCYEQCANNHYGPPACRGVCHCKYPGDCEQMTGTCSKGCAARFYGVTCQSQCSSGYYHVGYQSGCTKKCNCKFADDCNAEDGMCLGKCPDGWTGEKCEIQCADRTYGAGCNRRCHCDGNRPCDKTTGACPSRKCSARYHGEYCQQTCPRGKYMLNGKCMGRCFCRDNNKCRVTDGSCGSSRCIYIRKGDRCQYNCYRKFGDRCQFKCNCKNSAQCYHDTGECSNGCDARFAGRNCQETCEDNKFGALATPKCARTCHCSYNRECSVLNGTCAGGCDSIRRTGPACEKTCYSGKYLQSDRCSGICYCVAPDQCNVASGECVQGGCIAGRTGLSCQLKCQLGTWGRDCVYKCYCRDYEPCGIVTGVCPSGCVEGRYGDTCQLLRGAQQVTASHVGLIIGLTVLVLLIFILAVVGLITRRQKRNIHYTDPCDRRSQMIILAPCPEENQYQSLSDISTAHWPPESDFYDEPYNDTCDIYHSDCTDSFSSRKSRKRRRKPTHQSKANTDIFKDFTTLLGGMTKTVENRQERHHTSNISMDSTDSNPGGTSGRHRKKSSRSRSADVRGSRGHDIGDKSTRGIDRRSPRRHDYANKSTRDEYRHSPRRHDNDNKYTRDEYRHSPRRHDNDNKSTRDEDKRSSQRHNDTNKSTPKEYQRSPRRYDDAAKSTHEDDRRSSQRPAAPERYQGRSGVSQFPNKSSDVPDPTRNDFQSRRSRSVGPKATPRTKPSPNFDASKSVSFGAVREFKIST